MKLQKNVFIINQKPIGQLELCAEILQRMNCRSAEVLSAKWENFIPQKFLILEGKKRSANIVVTDRLILSQIESLPRLDDVLIFPSINYYHLYHLIKKTHSHQFLKFKGKKNFKVTHGFRYENVSRFDNDEIIRDILHHRSIKSGKFYKLKKGFTNESNKKT